MKALPWCGGQPLTKPTCDPSPRFRMMRVISLVFSSLTLVLMPKCPLCLATYGTLLTGVTLSTSVAGQVRGGFLLVSFGILILLTLSRIGRWYRRGI